MTSGSDVLGLERRASAGICANSGLGFSAAESGRLIALGGPVSVRRE